MSDEQRRSCEQRGDIILHAAPSAGFPASPGLDEVETIAAPVLSSPIALALAGREPAAQPVTAAEPSDLSRLVEEAAWQVRVPACGVTVTMRFRDARFGGEAAALAVARAYRAAVLAFVPQVGVNTRGRRHKSASAMPCVYFKPARPGRGAAWPSSTTDPDGQVRNRSFAVSVHGETEARHLAQAERLRMLDAEQRVSGSKPGYEPTTA